jgi:hypothetical protein
MRRRLWREFETLDQRQHHADASWSGDDFVPSRQVRGRTHRAVRFLASGECGLRKGVLPTQIVPVIDPIWRCDVENGHAYSLKLSAGGAKAIGSSEEPSGKPASEFLALEPLPDAMNSSEIMDKRAPRNGSKLAPMIALLRREEGATILALIEATGWLPHTTRTAITGVRKRGYSVVLDRSVEGASVYRLSDLQESELATSVLRTQDHKASPRQREARAKEAA